MKKRKTGKELKELEKKHNPNIKNKNKLGFVF